MTDKEIFDQVLTIGPDIDDQGGMASVLQLYRRELPAFHYLRSNSRHGTIAGLFPLAVLMCRLPFARLQGRRILHVHTADGKSFIRKSWIMAWGRLWGYKTIYHCHGAETKQYFARRGNHKIKRILDKCAATIVLSQSWKDYFTRTIGIDHIHVLNNIVTPTGSAPKKALGNTIQFLFMGAIGDRKGIFDLLGTIAENANRWRGLIHLTVGGDGEMDRYNKAISQYGIADMVTYIGWATGDKKDRAFKNSDIAILPSYNEGLPIFILEAMANGMPVISTPVGGIAEVVDNTNGFLVEPGDKQAIAHAIDAYVADPELIIRHGSGSSAKIAPFFPASVQAGLVAIYKSILNK